MEMTVEEAKTKKCPFSIYGQQVGALIKQEADKCIADKCMAWQSHDFKTKESEMHGHCIRLKGE